MKRVESCVLVLALAACASGPERAPGSKEFADGADAGSTTVAAGETRSGGGRATVDAAVQVAREPLRWQGGTADELSPSILLPDQSGDDAVIATVGDVQIRKSHVYDRMLENDRRGASVWMDLLVMDCVVAEQAKRLGVTVTKQEIAPLVEEEEGLLRAQVEVELGDRMTFDQYVQGQFGLTPEEYRSFVTLDLARVRYRSYVIRYLAMREDQAEVRFIVHRDPAVLEDLRQKVLAGADFATLARRWSEDETRRDGGRLAPFGRAFRHPIAQTAFQLEPGQVSAVVPFDGPEGTRHAIVYCLRRVPARELPFDEVRSEIAADLERRPVTPFEQRAFTTRYCRPTDAPTAIEAPR